METMIGMMDCLGGFAYPYRSQEKRGFIWREAFLFSFRLEAP